MVDRIYFIESLYLDDMITQHHAVRSKEAVDYVLGYDTAMMTVECSRGFQ